MVLGQNYIFPGPVYLASKISIIPVQIVSYETVTPSSQRVVVTYLAKVLIISKKKKNIKFY